MFKQLFFDESGQGMSEYGLILGLVAIASVTALSVGGKNIKNVFNAVNNVLGTVGIDSDVGPITYEYSENNSRLTSRFYSPNLYCSSEDDVSSSACVTARIMAAHWEIQNADDEVKKTYWTNEFYRWVDICIDQGYGCSYSS